MKCVLCGRSFGPDDVGYVKGSISGEVLELLPTGPQWRLRRGTTALGRSESADVYLDMPHVQEKRLISGHHATVRCSDGS